MIPPRILGELRAFRNREATIRFLRGAALWLALALLWLTLACLTDWWVDRSQETPVAVRWFLSVAQVVINLAGFYFLILRPLLRIPSLDWFANRAERRVPEYRHRLVTAYQLNRPGARRDDYSPDLLADVTREAEAITQRHRFANFADHRRLRWGLLAVVPAAAVVLLALLIFPETSNALLARQALLDREIPRSISIASVTPEVWPSGEPVDLRFEIANADGPIDPESAGEVRVWQEGQPLQRLRLEHAEALADDTAIFTARVPASSEPFEYRAFLGDGRMAETAAVRFEPRPVVNRLLGSLVLPGYVGTRPDGSPYERPQDQGEILGRPGFGARVRIEAQKPIRSATLVLLERESQSDRETVLEELPMMMTGEDAAEVTFTLSREQSAYRVEVRDEYGFANASPPRRNVAMAPDEPPQVELLPERFPAGFGGKLTEESVIDGLPVLLDGPIRVAYSARSPLGLGKAELVYRINDDPEQRLVLNEVIANEDVGEFDLRTGAFETMSFRDQVEFYRVPSASPEFVPDGLEGGGRLDFQTAGLRKAVSEGFLGSLEPGDTIEFHVEVRDRNPEPGRPPGRSETRIKTVVTGSEFTEWIQSLLETERKLRQLRQSQQDVFGGQPGERGRETP